LHASRIHQGLNCGITTAIAARMQGEENMARSRSNKRQKRALNTLSEKGAMATGLGVLFLLAPSLLGNSPLFKPLATVLHGLGWPVLGFGLLLLGIHFALKSKADKSIALPTAVPIRREPTNRQDAFGNIPPPAPGGVVAEARHAPFTKTRMQPQRATTWSPAVFAAIEWRRFEAVCETLFAQAGFQTRSQSHGADGGVDIWLHSANAQGPVAVVQCKHWQGKAVGVKEIREFFGVMASHQLKRGTYATTSTYTADAQQFAKDNGISALDGPALLALIAKRTPEQQQALLAVAHEGEYWRPTCASCGIKLLERTPTKGGATFWGCSNYPRCKSRLPMAAAAR
jgi:restriction system protein